MSLVDTCHGPRCQAAAKAEPAESKLKAASVRAKTAIHPSVNAALVITEFGDHFGDLDLAALVGHLAYNAAVVVALVVQILCAMLSHCA